MKKNNFIRLGFLFFLLCGVTTVFSQAQLQKWYLDGKEVDFGQNPPMVQDMVPLENSPGSGPVGTGSTNGIYGVDGDLILYVDDRLAIYNGSGELIDQLLVSGNFDDIGPEVEIIPVPGSSCKYNIVYYSTFIKDGQNFVYAKLFYSEVDLGLNNGAGGITPDKKDVVLLDDNDLSLAPLGGFAVGRLRSDDTRFLYFATHSGSSSILTKSVVSSTGISTPVILASDDDDRLFGNTETELSNDQSMLAFANFKVDSSPPEDVHIFRLDDEGNTVDLITINLPEANGATFTGCEFSADNNYLYVSAAGKGIYQILLSDLSYKFVTGSELYDHSQIEKAFNGKIYAAKSETELGFIDLSDPLSPTMVDEVNTTNPSIVSNSLSGNWGLAVLTIPDQIDGYTYEELFDGTSGSCCQEDDYVIDFHFQKANGTQTNVFSLCEDVFIDASVTDPMNGFYHMSIASVTSTGNVISQLGQTSWWTPGDLNDPINVTETFPNVNYQLGVIYRIKLDVYNEQCEIWMNVTHTFTYEEVSLTCIEEKDLTACETEENYGFIHLRCQELGGSVSYDWDFPSGSDAFEVSSGMSTFVMQASEGLYSVTITNGLGCTEVRDYEITQDCCEDICSTPTNLGCKKLAGQWVKLSWAAGVPGTTYTLVLNPNGTSCCGPATTTTYLNLPNNSYSFPTASNCFNWHVIANCPNGLSSSPSSTRCYKDGLCYVIAEEDNDRGRDRSPDTNPVPRVYPNPSSGDVNLELDTPGRLNITVEVYSLDGSLVKSFAEETYPDGLYKKQWSVDKQLVDGLYYVFFKTNYGTFQEKVVLSRRGRD